MLPARRWSGASKKPPIGGRPACVSSRSFALFGPLPSPTQIAPYRELNKYEANNGKREDRHLHDFTSCNSSRGHPASALWYVSLWKVSTPGKDGAPEMPSMENPAMAFRSS